MTKIFCAVKLMVNWSSAKLICHFLGNLIGYLFFIGLLNFVLSIWPYYIQKIVHELSGTSYTIDNFNLYVIGYTLFLIVITYFAPIINTSKNLLWKAFGAIFCILFLITTACLALEYHDYVSGGDKYPEDLRQFSHYMSIIFIYFNILSTFIVVFVQSVSYSYLKVKEV